MKVGEWWIRNNILYKSIKNAKNELEPRIASSVATCRARASLRDKICALIGIKVE